MPDRDDCLVRLPPLFTEDVAILEYVVRDEQVPCKRLVTLFFRRKQYLNSLSFRTKTCTDALVLQQPVDYVHLLYSVMQNYRVVVES